MTFLLGAALMLAAGCDRQKADAPQAPAGPGATLQAPRGLDRSHKGEAAPKVVFKDPDGEDISLAEMRGLPFLLNLWASWCAPCIKELPTLDAVEERHLVDGQFSVVAVSQDSGAQGSVKAFLAAHAIKQLAAFQDPEMGLTSALGVQTMPTSVLYDKNGAEVWRYVGEMDWTSAEATRLLAEAEPPAG